MSEILAGAEQTDRDEDERHGSDRGDELPEQFRTRESRSAALAEAMQRLEEQRSCEADAELPTVEVEIDAQRVVAEGHGRKGWTREVAGSLSSVASASSDRSPDHARIGY